MTIRVTLRPGENADKLVQRFKKACSKEGILKEIKKRTYYEKPSERRRRLQKEREKALRKRLAKLAAKAKKLTS